MNISERYKGFPGNQDTAASADDFPFSKAARLAWTVIPPIILILGTFGNTMSIAVHHRLSRKRQSGISVYLVALAVSDLLLLYSGLLVQWVSNLFKVNITRSSNYLCKLVVWFIYTSGAACAWLLVAVTLQRATSVVWPHRVNSLITLKRSIIVVLGLSGTLMLIHVHILYGWGVVVTNSSNNTFSRDCAKVTKGYLNFFDRIWSWVDLLVFSLVPFIILLGSNMVLLKTVVTSVQEARTRLSDKQQVTSRKKTASSMTITLIVLSFTFVSLTGPICVYLLMKPYVFDGENVSDETEALRRLVFAVMDLLWYSNSSINFYLYCLSGSKFRTELNELLSQFKRAIGVCLKINI